MVGRGIVMCKSIGPDQYIFVTEQSGHDDIGLRSAGDH